MTTEAYAQVPAEELLRSAHDLKAINGIGPAIERRLHDAGIKTYSQLAALSAQQVAEKLAGVAGITADRIEEMDWIGQARKMSGELAPTAPADAHPENTLHYETFSVKLLLDAENAVRRTHVVHIQDGEEELWAGWNQDRLNTFIRGQAGLQAIPAQPVPQQDPAVADSFVSRKPEVRLTGTLRLQGLQAARSDNGHQAHIIERAHPYQIALTLDLTDVNAARNTPLWYSVRVYARSLSTGERHRICDAADGFPAGGLVHLKLNADALPHGIYNLEAVAEVTLREGLPGLVAFLEEGIYRVL